MPDEKPKGVVLPENYDPYDMQIKIKLDPLADDMNRIELTTGTKKPYLACGAKTKNRKGFCCYTGGHGTDHKGYGRCKFHGGLSTGPKTKEGKEAQRQAVSKANTIHGLYASVLNEREKKFFNEFVEKDDIGLKFEIMMLKAKILSYLSKWSEKWEGVKDKEGEDVADKKTKVFFRESEGNGAATTFAYYHAGTIEDKPLIRALETLGRLIDKQVKITGEDKDDLIASINSELRAASHGQVQISWGGKAQSRESGKET